MGNSEGIQKAIASLRKFVKSSGVKNPLPLQLARISDFQLSTTPVSIETALADVQSSSQILVVLGQPGSGKSTLVQGAVMHSLDSGAPALYSALSSLIQASTGNIIPIISERVERSGIQITDLELLVIDAVDEANSIDISDLLDQIVEVSIGNPKLQIVVTCRTINFPSDASTAFAPYEILPVSHEQAFAFIRTTLDESRANQLWDKIPLSVRSLCETPLLLKMLTTLLENTSATDAKFENRSQIYAEYLEGISSRSGSSSIPADLRAEALENIAYAMMRADRQLPQRDLSRLASDFQGSKMQLQASNPAVFQRELLRQPPMGTPEGSKGEISFMHHTFKEFYAAAYLQRHEHEWTNLFLHLRSNAEGSSVTSVMYWREVLGFLSEMLRSSNDLLLKCVDELGHSAVGCELATVIVERASQISRSRVDQFATRLLEQFKYGGEFDYELITVLMRLLGKQDTDLPQRIISNVEYWHRKYSGFSPRLLRMEEFSDESLVEIASQPDHENRLNAIWTIAGRRLPISESLLTQYVLDPAESPIVREQAIVALGRLAAPNSLNVLTSVATNERAWRRERAYALHALAHFPSSENLDALLNALLQPDDETLSEDAAWAVSVIAESHPDLVEPYLNQLRQAFTMSNDGYTKGCIIFGLGRGKFLSCLDFVNEVLNNETDPFVLEDACYFVESTGFKNEETLRALEKLINNDPPLDVFVVMRAENAINPKRRIEAVKWTRNA